MMTVDSKVFEQRQFWSLSV